MKAISYGFKSLHPHHIVGASFACSDFFVLQKNQSPARRNKLRYLRFFALQKISRLLRCSSFSQKSLRCNLFCEFICQIIFPEANRASFACSDFLFHKKSVTCASEQASLPPIFLRSKKSAARLTAPPLRKKACCTIFFASLYTKNIPKIKWSKLRLFRFFVSQKNQSPARRNELVQFFQLRSTYFTKTLSPNI